MKCITKALCIAFLIIGVALILSGQKTETQIFQEALSKHSTDAACLYEATFCEDCTLEEVEMYDTHHLPYASN